MSSATVQPLNLLFTREAIAAQLHAVKARILFTPPPGASGGLYEKADGLKEAVPSLERIVVLPMDGRIAFDDETLLPSDDRDNADVADPDRIVALLPTGGTTSAPKIVPLSNRNVVSSAIGSMLAMDVRAERPQPHHTAAVSRRRRFCFTLPTFAAGATVVIPTAGGMRNPDVVANFWRIVETQRITLTGGRADRARRRRSGAARRGRRFAPSAGRDRRLGLSAGDRAALPRRLGRRRRPLSLRHDRIRRRHHPDAMGPREPLRFGRRAGRARRGRGAGEREIHLGPSPTGEILARGPQMFRGYLGAKQVGASFYEGWLRSGDLGRIGADGEAM